jgi:hypothetical protein
MIVVLANTNVGVAITQMFFINSQHVPDLTGHHQASLEEIHE